MSERQFQAYIGTPEGLQEIDVLEGIFANLIFSALRRELIFYRSSPPDHACYTITPYTLAKKALHISGAEYDFAEPVASGLEVDFVVETEMGRSPRLCPVEALEDGNFSRYYEREDLDISDVAAMYKDFRELTAFAIACRAPFN